MRSLFVIASLVMLSGFPMVLRRLFMMMSGFVVMLVDFVLRHFRLLPNWLLGRGSQPLMNSLRLADRFLQGNAQTNDAQQPIAASSRYRRIRRLLRTPSKACLRSP